MGLGEGIGAWVKFGQVKSLCQNNENYNNFLLKNYNTFDIWKMLYAVTKNKTILYSNSSYNKRNYK